MTCATSRLLFARTACTLAYLFSLPRCPSPWGLPSARSTRPNRLENQIVCASVEQRELAGFTCPLCRPLHPRMHPCTFLSTRSAHSVPLQTHVSSERHVLITHTDHIFICSDFLPFRHICFHIYPTGKMLQGLHVAMLLALLSMAPSGTAAAAGDQQFCKSHYDDKEVCDGNGNCFNECKALLDDHPGIDIATIQHPTINPAGQRARCLPACWPH